MSDGDVCISGTSPSPRMASAAVSGGFVFHLHFPCIRLEPCYAGWLTFGKYIVVLQLNYLTNLSYPSLNCPFVLLKLITICPAPLLYINVAIILQLI